MKFLEVTLFEPADQMHVTVSGKNVYEDALSNKGCSEPWGRPEVLRRHFVVYKLDLTQEEAESCNDESEAHQRQSSADPRKQRSFRGEVVTEAGILRRGFGTVQLI